MSAPFRLGVLGIGAVALSAILFAGNVLPSSRAIAFGIVCLAAIAFGELFRAARVADEPNASAMLQFEHALFPPPAVERRPVQLERVDRDIVLGRVADVWARHGLIRRLRWVTAARLASRGGIDLARDPDGARNLLGEDAWELVRADRRGPDDPYMQGVPLDDVEMLLDRLESL